MTYEELKITLEGVDYLVDLEANWCGAEPDVGIMGDYVDEWYITKVVVESNGVSIPQGTDPSDGTNVWERISTYLEDKLYNHIEPPEDDGPDYE